MAAWLHHSNQVDTERSFEIYNSKLCSKFKRFDPSLAADWLEKMLQLQVQLGLGIQSWKCVSRSVGYFAKLCGKVCEHGHAQKGRETMALVGTHFVSFGPFTLSVAHNHFSFSLTTPALGILHCTSEASFTYVVARSTTVCLESHPISRASNGRADPALYSKGEGLRTLWV